MQRTLVLTAALALAIPLVARADIHVFTVTSIDGGQETPPNASPSTGMGTFTLDDSTGVATFSITHDCCGTGETDAHVHGPAAPGTPAGIVYGLPVGNPKVGSSPPLSATRQAEMLSDLHYVNIHSNALPAGEIRGQIVHVSTTQLVPTKVLLVKNPPSGESRRKVVWKVKEVGSGSTVAGDPTASGATLRLALTPGGDQCFDLPAGGWSAVGSIGFKYKDKTLANGPVKVAFIKRTPSGKFLARAIMKGNGPETIDVVPGDPTSTYAVNLKIGDGDAYCSATDSATPKRNDTKTFKVVNDTTAAVCPVTACSASGAFLDPSAPLF